MNPFFPTVTALERESDFAPLRRKLDRQSRRFGMICVLILGLATQAFPGATLQLAVKPVVLGESLQLGSLRYENAAGERYSVTRASFLLSQFAFQRENGTWLELTNGLAWFDAESERTESPFDLPLGTYRALRFQVGLNPNLNHSDPALYPPQHPLNPNLNGLHWSWHGGYVFMALEGIWRSETAFDGWSYHLAREPNRTRVTLPLPLEFTNAARVEIEFDLARLFDAPRPLSFGKDGSSTHSRDRDPVAAALVANLPAAFRLRGVFTTAPPPAPATVKPLYLPVKYTPYPFVLSAAFPPPALPRDNPLIEERVALGSRLFHEPLLSRDEKVSCASCHDRRAAFADPRRFSVGVNERIGVRHSMPLFNLAWKSSFFWDGRAASLREQVLMPIQDHVEMDESLTNVVAKLTAANYGADFARAFGSAEVTAEKVGLAIEQFVLTLTSFDSKFDRARRGEADFTSEEKRGLELFMTEYDPRRGQFGADCFHCHGGPLFQSQTFANNGLDSNVRDAGRARVTGRSSDQGKFATPSLRNIELTAPYMHDGRFATLEEVIEHYSTGLRRSATLDPNLAKHPDGGLRLSNDDKRALIAFLKTLTDDQFRNGPKTAAVAAGTASQ